MKVYALTRGDLQTSRLSWQSSAYKETESEFVEVSRRHSTEKKSGRPEHEEKEMTGKYKGMQRMQKIRKKNRNHLGEATVNSARARMRGRVSS